MEGNRFRDLAITAYAPIMWGSTYVVTRHLLPADAPLWGAVIRALPAGLLVLAIARRLPRGRWWWRSFVLGTLNNGGFFVLVYVAGQRLPSGVAATVMSLSAGCLALVAWALLRQRPRVTLLAGAAVGLVGVVLMVGVSAQPVDPWGVLASAGAMLSSSIGFVLTVRWGRDEIRPLTMTAWQLLAGSVVLVPVAALVEGGPPRLDLGAALGFGYVTLLATAVAYVAWFTGLRRVSPGVAGVVGLLNPLTGTILGVLVGGESLTVGQAVGLLLVAVGIVVGARRTRSASGADPQPDPERGDRGEQRDRHGGDRQRGELAQR